MASSGFIDIHCHILPGVDDGANDLEESLQMLRIARTDRISTLFATPHIMSGTYDNSTETIRAAFEVFSPNAEGIDLYYGAEVSLDYETPELLEQGVIPTLGGSQYLLLELPAYTLPPAIGDFIHNLTQQGYRPIIAHPERHPMLANNYSKLSEWRDCGALFQLTARSVTGELGRRLKKLSHEMVKKGLVDFVASDAHSAGRRSPVLSTAYEATRKDMGSRIADVLFYSNPQLVLDAALRNLQEAEA